MSTNDQDRARAAAPICATCNDNGVIGGPSFQDPGEGGVPCPDCEDLILIPRGLIGAACSVIDKKRDAPKVLAELRRYTVGDLSAAAPQAAVGVSDAQVATNATQAIIDIELFHEAEPASKPEAPAKKVVNRYCDAGMCLDYDKEHDADCSRAAPAEAPANEGNARPALDVMDLSNVSLERLRPSRDWYTQLAKETLDKDAVIGAGISPALAAPAQGAATIQKLHAALETAKNGLTWYAENHPELSNGCDDEAMAEIEAALALVKAP